MIPAALAALAAAALAADPPAPCPDIDSASAYTCRAVQASGLGKPADAAAAFEQAAERTEATNPERARLYAAAGNSWLAADENGKAALNLDRALAATGLQAEQRGEVLLDRARAAQALNDLATARARIDEAKTSIAGDPFLWYFSAALAIREGDQAAAKASIGHALALAPADPLILFEAGHVAHFTGDDVGARGYWERVVASDPKSAPAAAARDALRMLPVRLTVQSEANAPK